MAREDYIMRLGKFVIAVAWANGKLESPEIHALKDLLFSIGEISAEQWKRLEIYMDSPVEPEERGRLLEELLEVARSSGQRQHVMDTLRKLAACDGEVTAEEEKILAEVSRSLESHSTGFLGQLGRLIGSAIGKQEGKCRKGPDREERFGDFIRNTVYFQLAADLQARGDRMSLPEEEVRKICLAAGLMAQIAWVDSEISEAERSAMEKALREHWGAPPEEADLIAEISVARAVKGLDHYRLCREFYASTTLDERRSFLRVLFQIANACGKTSNEETQAIGIIGHILKISHKDFIIAKLTIPREDRGGM